MATVRLGLRLIFHDNINATLWSSAFLILCFNKCSGGPCCAGPVPPQPAGLSILPLYTYLLTFYIAIILLVRRACTAATCLSF